MAFEFNENSDYDINELLQQYRSVRSGKGHYYLEEEAYELLINYYLDRDQSHKALEAANIGLENFPMSSILYIKKADIVIELGKYDEAMQLLNMASLYDPTNINIIILKTDIYLATDQQPKAIALINEAKNSYMGNEKIELLFELSDVYDDYGHFNEVFDCLAEILEIDFLNEEALYKICFWAEHTNRNEESVLLHQKIIDENPYSELAWFNLGSALQSLKLYEKAIEAYLYALAIDEKFDYAHRNIADAYIKLRNYRKAIENLKRVIELGQPEDIIYEAIAYCYEKLKNPAEARFYYKKALTLTAQVALINYKIACTYMMQENWLAATNFIQTAIAIQHENADYNYTLAVCYFQLDKYDLTIEYALNAIHKKSKRIKYWELLLVAHYYLDKQEEGLELVQLAKNITNFKFPILYFYESLMLIGLKKIKAAIPPLEYAMKTNPKNLKIIIEIEPGILQYSFLLDVISKYKRK